MFYLFYSKEIALLCISYAFIIRNSLYLLIHYMQSLFQLSRVTHAMAYPRKYYLFRMWGGKKSWSRQDIFLDIWVDGGIPITCITINIVEYTFRNTFNHIIRNTQSAKLQGCHSHLLQTDIWYWCVQTHLLKKLLVWDRLLEAIFSNSK